MFELSSTVLAWPLQLLWGQCSAVQHDVSGDKLVLLSAPFLFVHDCTCILLATKLLCSRGRLTDLVCRQSSN